MDDSYAVRNHDVMHRMPTSATCMWCVVVWCGVVNTLLGGGASQVASMLGIKRPPIKFKQYCNGFGKINITRLVLNNYIPSVQFG